MIKVVVAGAAGRMGQEVLRAVHMAEGMELVGAVDRINEGVDIGTLIGAGELGIFLTTDLEETLVTLRPDVLVDFTTPEIVFNDVKIALKCGVRPVVGTTGMGSAELAEIRDLCQKAAIGCIVAPNFAIGALLMIKFATEAVKYMPHVEIIELHHDKKLDAPSGTAIKTAEQMSQVRGDFRQGLAAEIEKIAGARGGEFDGGIRIHSVRLPGYVAHQEVIFGGIGQTLTIRHDSISRESFMPGVVLAVQKIVHLDSLVYGLENILFE